MTSIRPATDDDLATMVALDVALFGRNAWSEPAMQTELATTGRDRVVLVAQQGPAVVGYAVGLLTGDVAELLRIGVTPTARRLGVGSGLLDRLAQAAVAAGCVRLLLEVDAADECAHAFYRQHGFVEISRRPGYYPDGADAAVLSRDLERRTTT